MNEKTIVIEYAGQELKLRVRKLLMGDFAAAARIIDSLEINGNDMFQMVGDLINTEDMDQFMRIALSGELPADHVKTWMPLEEGIQVIDDFLELNAGLIQRLNGFLSRINETLSDLSLTGSTPKTQRTE